MFNRVIQSFLMTQNGGSGWKRFPVCGILFFNNMDRILSLEKIEQKHKKTFLSFHIFRILIKSLRYVIKTCKRNP